MTFPSESFSQGRDVGVSNLIKCRKWCYLAIYILRIHLKCETMKSIYNASFDYCIYIRKLLNHILSVSGQMLSELLLSLVIRPSSLNFDRDMYAKLGSFEPSNFSYRATKILFLLHEQDCYLIVQSDYLP